MKNKVAGGEVEMTKNILDVKHSTSLYQLFEVPTWSIWINVQLRETLSVLPAWLWRPEQSGTGTMTEGTSESERGGGRGDLAGVAVEGQVAFEENEE